MYLTELISKYQPASIYLKKLVFALVVALGSKNSSRDIGAELSACEPRTNGVSGCHTSAKGLNVLILALFFYH